MTQEAIRQRLSGVILLLGSAAATAAILTVPPIGQADARQATCGPSTAKTIVANDRIRVYKEAAPRGEDGDIEACLEGTQVHRVLETQVDTTYTFRPPALQLRGPMIGTATDFCDQETGCETLVTITDFSKTLSERTDVINSSAGKPRRLVKVGSLRFRPNGSMAWIACTENDPEVFSASRQPNCVRPGPRGRKWVMRKRVGASTAEVLDTGDRIDPSSLRLSGSRLVWKEAGRRKSRRLP